MRTLSATIRHVTWYLQIAVPLLLCSCIPLDTPPATADLALTRMVATCRLEPPHPRDVPPSFSETKEGTCTLKLSQDFEDQDGVVNVSVGDKLKVTYRFRLCKSDQNGHVLCAEKDVQVPCEKPMTYECQVAFFDNAGKLLGTDRAFGRGFSPKSPSFFNATETHDILTIEGLADQVASYKLIYHEFEDEPATSNQAK